jgi:hypothetical protein
MLSCRRIVGELWWMVLRVCRWVIDLFNWLIEESVRCIVCPVYSTYLIVVAHI